MKKSLFFLGFMSLNISALRDGDLVRPSAPAEQGFAENPLVELAKLLLENEVLTGHLNQQPIGTKLTFLSPDEGFEDCTTQPSGIPGYLIATHTQSGAKKFKKEDSGDYGQMLITMWKEEPSFFCFLIRAINTQSGELVEAPVQVSFEEE